MHIRDSISFVFFVISVYPSMARPNDGVCVECIQYNFETGFDSFFPERGVCEGLSNWTKGKYSSLEIELPNELTESFITPTFNLSCTTSFSFTMSGGGTIEVKVYMDSADANYMDQVIVLAEQLSANHQPTPTMGLVILSSRDLNFVNGWQTLSFTLLDTYTSTFEGQLTFMASANVSSTLLVDSFCYKPRNYVGDCWEYISTPEQESTTNATDTEPTTVTEADPTTVKATEGTTVKETEPTSVTSTEPTTVTATEGTTVKDTERTTVTNIKTTTVRDTEPTTVTGTEPTKVTATERTTVTDTEGTTVTDTERTTVTDIKITTLKDTESSTVSQTGPTKVTETETEQTSVTEITSTTAIPTIIVPKPTLPTVPTPAPVTNKCPADPSIHWLLPHEYDCNLFYYCVWGAKVERNCAAGLHFNPILQVCDWPWRAGCTTQ